MTATRTTTEVVVILHTVNGDVRTAYPVAMIADALAHFAQYIVDGKRATMTNEE